MTTETTRPRRSGVGVLLRTLVVAVVAGTLLVGCAALLGGTPGALGAAVGCLLTLVVLGTGTLVVYAAAGVLPRAALLIALLTYLLQVLALALGFVLLSRSGLLDGRLSREWLAAGVVLVTVAWMVGQIHMTTRLRFAPLRGPVLQGEP